MPLHIIRGAAAPRELWADVSCFSCGHRWGVRHEGPNPINLHALPCPACGCKESRPIFALRTPSTEAPGPQQLIARVANGEQEGFIHV